MHDRIRHEIAIICRAEGIKADLSHLFSEPPFTMALSLHELKLDDAVVNIVAGWGDTLTDREVLFHLKSINDKGMI
ncbi:hypothetical protein GO755_20775 [Spirosoma sp. HMF4905]|uniref:Uncharacterized protein n=1 Tax=Spirosoma arboris TaxID=2682092 RepID=A0A7K1SF98_9BACT|nr:hypothetical protein [Spirosoma arboris]MVM32489.1 hypothetical protein [Spirosoma arboris]